jgi:DNA-binding LacI/PurR family transcriptional regulator
MSSQRSRQESPKIRKATMADVAQAAGVGLTTVSYALSGKGNLPDATREAVLRAAREVGYESNYFAQNIKAPYRDVVALCVGSDLGINTLTVWALQHHLDERGYTLEVHTKPSYVSDAERKQAALLHSLRRQKPRALVCEISGLDQAGIDELKFFVEKGGLLCDL